MAASPWPARPSTPSSGPMSRRQAGAGDGGRHADRRRRAAGMHGLVGII